MQDVADTEVNGGRARCRVHNIAMGDDGRCLLCARDRPDPEPAARGPWPIVGVGAVIFFVVLGAYALRRQSDRQTPIPDPVAAQPRANPAPQPPQGAQAPAPQGADPKKIAEQRRQEALDRQEAIEDEMHNVPITVYATAKCCDKMRTWLADNDYSFREKDPEKDESAREQLSKLNPAKSVPTFDIDGVGVVGFTPRRVELVLRQAAIKRLE